MNWQPIEIAPNSTDCLVAYKDSNGKYQIAIACYWPAHTLNASCQDNWDEIVEYENAYYCLDGWYFKNREYSEQIDYLKMRTKPILWMPLLSPPEEDN